MNQLNERQQASVNYVDGPLLVLAGAGSGKTSVITRKVCYLVETCGLSARHIAAVTFTNKAAREMKERVGQLLKGSNARGLTVSTFHNLGLNIIRQELGFLGLRPGFSIFDSQDANALLKGLLSKDDGDDAKELIDGLQYQISNWKNDLISPEQAQATATLPNDQLAARIYQKYERQLRAYNGVDFDDLILLPTVLFQTNPDVLARWQKRIRYLLVDEYQDTNTSQYELVKLLVGGRSGLTVVGDDSQSIYAWRGARPENMQRLEVDFPGLQVIKLEQNYRSTARILRAANQLISNNPNPFEKNLWSEMGDGDYIRVIMAQNDEKEAERIATDIIEQRLRRGGKYLDFAVLYRGNHQSRVLEMKLQHYQIPYRLSGGTSFFSRSEVKDIMSYLRLLVNPDDDNAFLRVINLPRREIGAGTLEKLSHYAGAREVSMLSACAELGLKELLTAKAAERLSQFQHWIERISQRCYQEDPIATIKQMIADMAYEDWLYQNSNSDLQAERRMANVWFLLDSLERTLNRLQEEDESADISHAIARLLLIDMLERQEDEDDMDRVQLLTLHASKGLEFPHVYIMGMEEELLPHRNSIETDYIDEERRLAYVGITRARRSLTLTLAKKRKQFGEIMDTSPSRFLDELPEDDLEWEGRDDNKDPESNRAHGQETLSGLRALFD